jgi:hypothetical protein
MPKPVGATATPDQTHATKAMAVAVMHRYEDASRQAYHGMPTFTKPPRVPGVSVPPPASPPQPTPIVSPPPPARQPVPTDPTTTTSSVTIPASSVTTPSDFVGPAAGGIGATGFGVPGGLAGGVSGGLAGGAAAVPQPGAVSGAGMLAVTEGQLSAMTAAEAQQAGWSGFAPMGAGGRPGEQDGEHRDRYAGRPDIFGDLPPAFPPVLGL